MFFLGISTHFIIYLFIPTILILWFYFKGITSTPKDIIVLPEEIECRYVIRNSVENICFYEIGEKVSEPQEVLLVGDATSCLNKYVSSFYLRPILQSKALRAPPISL